MNEQHTPVPARRGIDRRSVVRAGVWTVPVVTLATAAPAFAASNAKGELKFDTFNVFPTDFSGGDPTKLESQIQVQNKFVSGGPTVTSLTVLVTYPDSRTNGAAPSIVSGPGWTFGSAMKSGSNWVYSFVWTGTLAPSASTPPMDYKVPLTDSSKGEVDLTAIASATNATSATAAASTKLK